MEQKGTVEDIKMKLKIIAIVKGIRNSNSCYKSNFFFKIYLELISLCNNSKYLININI